jgi:D-3-phosphoglycerate dehydrogenase
MPKVLLVDPALATMVAPVREAFDGAVEVAVVGDFGDDELRRHAAGASIWINARRPIDAHALALGPDLRFLQQIGAGTDPVDRDAAAASGITLAFNPGVNRTGVAEQTIMLMLALLKRLALTEAATRAGRFAPGEVLDVGIDDLADAAVGLIGMGFVGQSIVERLVPFGPTIRYHTRRPVPEMEARFGIQHVSLDELLRRSTIVSIHVPMSPETRHLIGEAQLAAMPRGSYLINMGRGGQVDETALRAAIVEGHLAGAALDVLEDELTGTNPFADLPQVIVTPHLGGASRNSMGNVVARCVANIRRYLAGDPLEDVIDLGAETATLRG